MDGKELGKINRIEVGFDELRFGVHLDLSLGGGSSGVGAFQPLNNTDDITKVKTWLDSAKVRTVAELKGKPIEVTIEGNALKSWRILTEVL